jgi:hypothetical protein
MTDDGGAMAMPAAKASPRLKTDPPMLRWPIAALAAGLTERNMHRDAERKRCKRHAKISGGRRLQDDYRIIAVDGKRFIDADFDIFPTIAVDWQEIGMAAFEECLALIEYPGRRRRIWLPGTLFEN